MGSVPDAQPSKLATTLTALRASLSPAASIDFKGDANYAVSSARWSDLGAPKPGAVINIASEEDIVAAVRLLLNPLRASGSGWPRFPRSRDCLLTMARVHR